MGLTELLGTYGQNYLNGLLTTWSLTAVSFVFVMVLAVAVTVMRVSPFAPLRVVGDLYVQVFRNIPGVALLIIIAYALPDLNVVLDWRTCVIVTTILMGSAFGSENFMSGINTIGVGQIEAARSIGLSFGQILRRIVIPQALRTTVLPTKMKLTGLCLGEMPTRLRRMAAATAETASSCPTMCCFSRSSSSDRRLNSSSRILLAGILVHSSMTRAIFSIVS